MPPRKTHLTTERSQGADLEQTMTTILIILVLFLVLGGGYYGYRRRW
jgi:hypothetical protein